MFSMGMDFVSMVSDIDIVEFSTYHCVHFDTTLFGSLPLNYIFVLDLSLELIASSANHASTIT